MIQVKTNRTRLLTSFALAMLAPSMCFAENEAASAEVTATDASTSGEVQATAEERKRAPASNFLPIVRGRFPLLLVHAVRFDEALNKMGTKDVAAKMATSVGKVFDIRKGRNFAYLTKDFKPSAADVADAKTWAAQIGQNNAKGLAASGDAKLVNDIIAAYEAAGLATAEETAKFTASKPRSNFEGKGAGGSAAAPGATNSLPASAENASKAGNADDLLA